MSSGTRLFCRQSLALRSHFCSSQWKSNNSNRFGEQQHNRVSDVCSTYIWRRAWEWALKRHHMGAQERRARGEKKLMKSRHHLSLDRPKFGPPQKCGTSLPLFYCSLSALLDPGGERTVRNKVVTSHTHTHSVHA